MALLVAPIVEGHAEVAAVPILVRRIQQTFRPQSYLEVLRPIRQPKNQLVTRAGAGKSRVDWRTKR